MPDKCKLATGNSQTFVILLTDLSKAWDCLPDEFLITKPDAHGFSVKVLKLINNNRPRRIKEQK